MEAFTRTQLQQLMRHEQPPCVSLFMPTHRRGSEQDPIRWKNLLRQAEGRLTANGLRPPEARDFLDPARQLLDNDAFWQNQADGLAAFVAPGVLKTYPVPFPLPELVVTTRQFQVKPLLPLLGNERFYLLSLSQNRALLYQGNTSGMEEVTVEQMPANLAEALRFHDVDEMLNYHTQPAPGGRGRFAAIFHGHGVGIDDHKDDLLRYFQQIDRGLHDLLREERVPLVLASVEYLWPIYRTANKYPHLVETGIPGNPDQMPPAELHRRALALVEPRFTEGRRKAVALYEQLAGTGRTSNDLKEIVAAAFSGQLEVLFVAQDREVWGSYDPATGQVAGNDSQQPDACDLLNVAAVHTLLHGGTVHVVAGKDVPGGKEAAAMYRVRGGER
jgi:hypothetical protein